MGPWTLGLRNLGMWQHLPEWKFAVIPGCFGGGTLPIRLAAGIKLLETPLLQRPNCRFTLLRVAIETFRSKMPLGMSVRMDVSVHPFEPAVHALPQPAY